jgi:hypothetical protein
MERRNFSFYGFYSDVAPSGYSTEWIDQGRNRQTGGRSEELKGH